MSWWGRSPMGLDQGWQILGIVGLGGHYCQDWPHKSLKEHPALLTRHADKAWWWPNAPFQWLQIITEVFWQVIILQWTFSFQHLATWLITDMHIIVKYLLVISILWNKKRILSLSLNMMQKKGKAICRLAMYLLHVSVHYMSCKMEWDLVINLRWRTDYYEYLYFFIRFQDIV